MIREIFVKVHKEKELLREKKLVQNNQPVCGLLKAEVAEVLVADICCSAEQSLELSLKVSAIFRIVTHTDFLFLHLHSN